MSRYLRLARTAVVPNEINEKDEESPRPSPLIAVSPYEINEKSLSDLTDLVWMHVSREEVEASKPPADWDGVVPDGCRWPGLCRTLGPCPHHLSRASCRIRERAES